MQSYAEYANRGWLWSYCNRHSICGSLVRKVLPAELPGGLGRRKGPGPSPTTSRLLASLLYELCPGLGMSAPLPNGQARAPDNWAGMNSVDPGRFLFLKPVSLSFLTFKMSESVSLSFMFL